METARASLRLVAHLSWMQAPLAGSNAPSLQEDPGHCLLRSAQHYPDDFRPGRQLGIELTTMTTPTTTAMLMVVVAGAGDCLRMFLLLLLTDEDYSDDA